MLVKDGQQIQYGFLDVHKIDYFIITQGIQVNYLKTPAPKRGFLKEELLIVPGDTLNSHMHML